MEWVIIKNVNHRLEQPLSIGSYLLYTVVPFYCNRKSVKTFTAQNNIGDMEE